MLILYYRFGPSKRAQNDSGGEGVRLISVRCDPLKFRNSISLQGYRAIIVQHSPFQSAGIQYKMWGEMWGKLDTQA